MKSYFLRFIVGFFCICFVIKGFSQVQTNVAVLQKTAQLQADKENQTFVKLLTLSKERNWPMLKRGRNGQLMQLVGIDHFGYPQYLSTQNNIVAAATIGTSTLWPGGNTGLNLSGSSGNMKGKLAVWDGGAVRSTHVELKGRIFQKDNATSIDDHTTHVSGTLIAAGVKPEVKGMAFGAQQLIAYDFNHDMSEMAGESSNLLVSNHSYAYNAGWVYNEDDKRWEFWGAPNATEDYKFGYYDDDTQLWDSIAYNAPNYLIVKAVGNSRESNGPKTGATYWRMDKNGTFYNAGPRPAGISSNDGYDIIPTTGVAKNILTVGAINPIVNGYSKPADAVMSLFSSWGPTDDGRIKPDVVADGVNVTSSIATSDSAYATFSGTSMASPSVAGSIYLLQELYSKLHQGAFLRAATLKGIVIHTADEAGANVGPDYQFGWGVVDIKKAAAVISSNNTDQLIYEKVLNNGKSDTIKVVASGKGKLMATLSWTDPKANVDETNTLNNRTKKLVNDLDLRIKTGSTISLPWILDVANPSAAATKGDNITDNVERVEVANALPGDTSLIIVTHKNTLSRGSQAYSLIISGVGGNTTCTSAATNAGGIRLEKVTIGNVNYSNTTACKTYTNNKSLSLNMQSNTELPFDIKVSSCDATNAASMIKIFIDYNNDGDFDDAGETVAQSGILNNGDEFTGTIQAPQNLVTGNSFLMRIVAVETNNINIVQSCGAYANGETQDYLVIAVPFSNDVGILQVLSPVTGNCANTAQYITVRIENFGSVAKDSIPVNVVVSNGGNIVATINEIYPGSIDGFSYKDFTLQTSFASVSGVTYTITAKTVMPADQYTANDQAVASVSIANPSADPAGRAIICGSDNVSLIADSIAGSGDLFNWYTSATSATPIATGGYVTTNVVTGDKKYYLAKNDSKLSIGATDKASLGAGDYKEGGNFFSYSAALPLTIETARLYVKNPGKVTFIVCDTSDTDVSTGSFYYSTLTSNTIDVYSTVNGSVDNGAVFYTNISVPAGNHILMVTTEDNGATLFRNNGVKTNNYPYSIPGVFSITGNSAGITPGTNYQNFYYFLYDMKLRLNNCVSNRLEIDASTASPALPVITLSGNLFSSTVPTPGKLQWLLTGIPIAGATGQTYIARSNGAYKLADTTYIGCIVFSNEIYYGNGSTENDPLMVWPNPNSGTFNLSFNALQQGDMKVLLFNSVGQKVYENLYSNVSGSYLQQINVGLLATGVYILRVEQAGKIYTKKMIVRSWD